MGRNEWKSGEFGLVSVDRVSRPKGFQTILSRFYALTSSDMKSKSFDVLLMLVRHDSCDITIAMLLDTVKQVVAPSRQIRR